MSRYYSVATSNHFAGLEESDGTEEILAEKPAHIAAAEAAAAAATALGNQEAADKKRVQKVRPQRKAPGQPGQQRGERSGFQGSPGTPSAAAPGATRRRDAPQGDSSAGEAQKDNRQEDSRAATRQTQRKFEKGGKFGGIRDGQKRFDRQGGQRKPEDDVDPSHVKMDEEMAERDTDEGTTTEKSDAVAEVTKLTLAQVEKEIAADRYQVETAAVVNNTDLQKEMRDAGYTEVEIKPKEFFSHAKRNDPSRKRVGKDVEGGEDIAPRRKTRSFRKDNRDEQEEQQEEEVQAPKRKMYKDMTAFPALGP